MHSVPIAQNIPQSPVKISFLVASSFRDFFFEIHTFPVPHDHFAFWEQKKSLGTKYGEFEVIFSSQCSTHTSWAFGRGVSNSGTIFGKRLFLVPNDLSKSYAQLIGYRPNSQKRHKRPHAFDVLVVTRSGRASWPRHRLRSLHGPRFKLEKTTKSRFL